MLIQIINKSLVVEGLVGYTITTYILKQTLWYVNLKNIFRYTKNIRAKFRLCYRRKVFYFNLYIILYFLVIIPSAVFIIQKKVYLLLINLADYLPYFQFVISCSSNYLLCKFYYNYNYVYFKFYLYLTIVQIVKKNYCLFS